MPLLKREMMHYEFCAQAFGRIGWAFLFFIDIRIGVENVHVDLLPDFIGWAIIASALGSILELHSEIRPIRTLAWWLVFLTLFDVVEVRILLSRTGPYKFWITPTFPLMLIALVLEIIVIWRLCGVIMDMAEAARVSVMRERADFRRKLYVGLVVALCIAVAIAIVVPPFLFVAFVVGLPVSIIVFCLMIGLMLGTRNMCRDYRLKTGSGTGMESPRETPLDWAPPEEPIDWTPPPEEPIDWTPPPEDHDEP